MSARRQWLIGLAINNGLTISVLWLLFAGTLIPPVAGIVMTGSVSGFLLRHAWEHGWRLSAHATATRIGGIAGLLGGVPATLLWLTGHSPWQALIGWEFGVLFGFSVLAVREARELTDRGAL